MFYYLRRPSDWFLTTSDRVPQMAVFLAIACAGHIAGNVVLIPRYGASGAGAASPVGYAVGAGLAWLFFVRLAGNPDIPQTTGKPGQTAEARL